MSVLGGRCVRCLPRWSVRAAALVNVSLSLSFPGMILPDLRPLLLLLLLPGGARPSRPAQYRPPQTGTELPADGTSESRPNWTDRTGFQSEPLSAHQTPPGENRYGIRSEPNWTNSGIILELQRTETESSLQPNKTKTYPLSEPNRNETHSPSEPNRTETHSPSEPNRTETHSPSEPNRTENHSPSEPNRTETHSPSELNGTEVHSPSEPNRTERHSPSEPNRTETHSPSEPNRTETHSPSEFKRTEVHSPSEPNRTERHSISEPNRNETHSPSESNRIETYSPPEPNRTETPSQSEPYKNETYYQSEPNRTKTHFLSDPNRIEAHSPSELNRTETHSPSSGLRDKSDLFVEEARTQAELDQMGRRNHYWWDITQTEGDFTRTDRQTNSDSIITQKTVTRRHISKRTPNMDTTSISTTFTEGENQTLLTVNHTKSDITENLSTSPTSLDSTLTNTGTEDTASITNDLGNTTYHSGSMTQVTKAKHSGNTTFDSESMTQVSVTSAKDSGNTTYNSDSMTQVSVTTAKDSGNATQGFVSVTQDSGISTEISGINNTDTDLFASITYPLQTPSYLQTTHQSPTSHQASESSYTFTSIPVTAPNTTSDVHGTDIPTMETTFMSSSSNSTNSSLSTFPASSSENSPSEEAGTFSNQSSSDFSSSSPIPSTLVSSSYSTFFTFPSAASPKFTSTKSSAPQTTLLTTPALPTSLPSVPPSLYTTSTSDDNIQTSMPFRTSLPPARTDQTSEAYNSSTTSLREPYTTESDQKVFHVTTPAFKDLITTLRSTLKSQTLVTPLEDIGPQSTATTYVAEIPAQTTNLIPQTTSRNQLVPTSHFSTQGYPKDIPETTTPGSPALATGDPTKQETTMKTTSIMPKVETSTSNRENKKMQTHTTAQPAVVTLQHSTTTETSPPTMLKPTSPTTLAPANVCFPNPCHNGGSCIQRSGPQRSYRCDCPIAWQGHHCDTDVDECLSRPCPAEATCVNVQGSFTCHCPLGYIMEKGTGCVQVRTFLGHIEIPRSSLNGSNGKYTKLQQIEEEIVQILNSSFSAIGGYYQSSVTNSSYSNRIELSVQNIFLLTSNVTLYDLRHNIQRYRRWCQATPEYSSGCQLILSELYYIAISLCNVKNPGCDNETSECSDPAGIAQCQCKTGYFKYSTADRSCRACDDGYRLQDGACVRCPFGLGGFNCSNPYQLITVIISAAGGGLLLILGIALAITCCRKSRHDISKLIFKSGDLQMSPYAEYPKTQRSSDWGRETIEMQENGSTKNLLQMNDVYYSAALRNSEIERNGLYPYTGVPGSRHSCIYPGQYNPTFINEENRRRDYF